MATSDNRKALNARLWSLVKHLPGGEEAMRDMVAHLRREDKSGQEFIGTDDYTSTRLLSDRQFKYLLKMVSDHAQWPDRRRGQEGNVIWFVSAAERKYINFLAIALKWSHSALAQFVERQTGGRGVRTHKSASAIIEPMERMLREKGWTCTETKGIKWWEPSEEET